MKISAQQVKELRDRTGIGVMDCKSALVEAKGDVNASIEILRKKGMAKAERKSGRVANEGVIWSYIHPGNKLGVLLEINCETDFVARNNGFQAFAKDIAMHIAATNPIVIKRADIDESILEKEREIYRAQARDQNKPEKIIEKIAAGKLEKFYKESCLLEQPFVKDPQKSVKDYITETIAKTGENISISRFIRYQLGETDKE